MKGTSHNTSIYEEKLIWEKPRWKLLLESTAPIQPHNETIITMFRELNQGAPTPYLGKQPKENRPKEHQPKEHRAPTQCSTKITNQNISCNPNYKWILQPRHIIYLSVSPLLCLTCSLLFLSLCLSSSLCQIIIFFSVLQSFVATLLAQLYWLPFLCFCSVGSPLHLLCTSILSVFF